MVLEMTIKVLSVFISSQLNSSVPPSTLSHISSHFLRSTGEEMRLKHEAVPNVT